MSAAAAVVRQSLHCIHSATALLHTDKHFGKPHSPLHNQCSDALTAQKVRREISRSVKYTLGHTHSTSYFCIRSIEHARDRRLKQGKTGC